MPIILPKSVFVHIPKTGGTWVHAVLNKMDLIQNVVQIHATPNKFRKLIGDRLYFTFVRNPVTWYQSRWSGLYARNHHPVKLKNQPGFEFINDDELNNFKLWADNVLERTSLTLIYKNYLGENLDGCDFIGKTENLSNDLIEILTKTKENFNPDFAKTTEKENKSVFLNRYYSKPLLEKVIDYNYDIMTKFGYSTDWQTYSNLIE